jgi:hypothetical protein
MKLTIMIFIFFIAVLSQGVVMQHEITQLCAGDPEADDNFGNAVDISGDYAIIGAYGSDDFGSSSGSAYVFKRFENTWEQTYKLCPSGLERNDLFGLSVAISGDYAIVGAYHDNDAMYNSGAAYVFVRNGEEWFLQTKLIAPDADDSDCFGTAVDICGDYAIVAATMDDEFESNSGAAYIYQRVGTNWFFQSKLTAADPKYWHFFGRSVSISENYTIVGTDYDDDNGTFSGAAYIFEKINNNWYQSAKITASDSESEDRFGYAVSISDSYAAIGAYGKNGGTGACYIFKNDDSNWVEEVKLLASELEQPDYFGYSIDIDNSTVIVGSKYDDDVDASGNIRYNRGSATIFTLVESYWVEVAKLTDSDGEAQKYFGCDVGISGNYAISGASGDDDDGNNSGSAYVFSKTISGTEKYFATNSLEKEYYPAESASVQFIENHSETVISVNKYNQGAVTSGILPEGISTISNQLFWQVVSSEGNVGLYDITFNLSDINYNDNFTSIKFVKRDGSTQEWQNVEMLPEVVISYNEPEITIHNLSGFSDFAPAESSDNPLPVILASFLAIPSNSQTIQLNWSTQSETNIAGFNLYRASGMENNEFFLINPALLEGTNTSSQQLYSYDDTFLVAGETYYYQLECVELTGNSILFNPICVTLPDEQEENPPSVPKKIGIQSIFPNPFNPSTKITYYITSDNDSKIEIYNAKGQQINQFSLAKEESSILWNGDDYFSKPVTSGIYFIKLSTEKYEEIKKVVLIK